VPENARVLIKQKASGVWRARVLIHRFKQTLIDSISIAQKASPAANYVIIFEAQWHLYL